MRVGDGCTCDGCIWRLSGLSLRRRDEFLIRLSVGNDRARRREEMPGRKEGFAKVPADDLLRRADCGEVDARVPAEQHIDVRRYMLRLHRGRKSWLPKGRRRFDLGARQSRTGT